MNDNDFELNTAPDGAPNSQPESTTPESASELIKPTESAEITTEPTENTEPTEPIEPAFETETTEPTAATEAFPVPTHEEPAKAPEKSEPQNQTITIKQEASKSSKPKKERRQKAEKQPKPAPQPAVAPVAAETPKKRNRSKAVLIGLLLMIIAAAATWFIMANLDSKSATDTPTEEVKPEVVEKLTAQEVVAKISQEFAESLTPNYPASKVLQPEPTSEGGPIFKFDDNSFYTNSSVYYPLEAQADEDSADQFLAEAEQIATKTLRDESFSIAATPDLMGNPTTYQNAAYAVTCLLKTITDSYIIECADNASFEDRAKAIAPFATAAQKDDKSIDIFYGQPVIKDSKSSGYQNATISVQGAASLFYRQGTDDWKYFQSTQQAIACSEFNSVELQNAFLDEPCLTADGQSSTVAVES